MKLNFDWNEFLLSLEIKVKELAELLGVFPSFISGYKRKNRISLNLKRKLEAYYGQEFVNGFIIKGGNNENES
jgi:transcriptional regulator with XRE-family HTH domain